MSPRIKIYDFVEREIDFFKKECNFSPEELRFFDLRARHKSIIEICFEMNISESKANTLSSSVKRKIFKVL